MFTKLYINKESSETIFSQKKQIIDVTIKKNVY